MFSLRSNLQPANVSHHKLTTSAHSLSSFALSFPWHYYTAEAQFHRCCDKPNRGACSPVSTGPSRHESQLPLDLTTAEATTLSVNFKAFTIRQPVHSRPQCDFVIARAFGEATNIRTVEFGIGIPEQTCKLRQNIIIFCQSGSDDIKKFRTAVHTNNITCDLGRDSMTPLFNFSFPL